MSFWDLMGAEKSDNPKSLLELEARTVLEDRSRREQELETNVRREKPPIRSKKWILQLKVRPIVQKSV